MEQFREVIELEENRIQNISGEMRATLGQEQEERQKIDLEISTLKQEKLESPGWKEKQEIDEMIATCRQRRGLRHFQNPRVLYRPYFGILELEDDDLGPRSYCLGSMPFFDRNSRVLVIDWRDAPVSRLYYEYDAGDDYEEIIQDRDRSGHIKSKRQVDTTDGILRKIAENGCLLVRDKTNAWKRTDKASGSVSRKEDDADHRLPEITALISSEQFRAITQPQAGAILLQGGAGSGKTTVGLHRIAYLAYQDPERFKPEQMLVVMFNRSLQRYISRALPELGVETGVLIETYHRWASKLFRMARMQISYNKETPLPKVAQFKRHSVMLALVDRYLEKLLKKSRDWFLEQLKQNNDPDFGKIAAILKPVIQFEELFQILNSHPAFFYESQPDSRNKLRERLLNRFHEHETDLYAVFSDQELLNELPDISGFPGKNQIFSLLDEWQAKLRDKKQIDFADTGILLWIMQRKGIHAVRPDYAHIMVDEAQDLSEVELATLLSAADKEQSVTICGDMAQKIKGDVSFDNPEGFAGFIRDLQERANNRKVCVDTLMVGYRATRPIMELAWSVLDKKPSMAAPRDGEAVEIIRTQGHDESVQRAGNILKTYLENRPNALVGIVCRYKADADRVFDGLKNFRMANLRRHERDDFSFHPGVIVTNAHQVKGLEFSGVIIINPSNEQYRNDQESRMLLHVVISRASDRLWILGHQPMAYGLEKWN